MPGYLARKHSERRDTVMRLDSIDPSWDVIVIGGGVTGAAVFRESVRMGLKTLLLEQKDFAWGTSSKSSKMVHGGLRYLKEGKFLLTRASVLERQRLLAQAPGLVTPLGFLMPVYRALGPSRLTMGLGLSVYSLMAGKKQFRSFSVKDMRSRAPFLESEGLTGGFYFEDAQVDDARLVFRLIQEGMAHGGCALNYTQVSAVTRHNRGCVAGICAGDVESGTAAELSARAVINATGVWAEELHPFPEKGLHIRPLRGSHLVFPLPVFPLTHVLSFIHPSDQRPVFMFPWENTAILGTTDVDHTGDLNTEPKITAGEIHYLLEGASRVMPGLKISEKDCIASFAGIRPVLSSGRPGTSASGESREHVVLDDQGLVTVTGGKLTTFRLLARDALKKASPYLGKAPLPPAGEPVFDLPGDPGQAMDGLPAPVRQRLLGRYGREAVRLVEEGGPGLLNEIPGTPALWAELAYAARHEQVMHLSDLLMRRTRLAMILPRGGSGHFQRIKDICTPILNWDDTRWAMEMNAYTREWESAYAPPERVTTKGD